MLAVFIRKNRTLLRSPGKSRINQYYKQKAGPIQEGPNLSYQKRRWRSRMLHIDLGMAVSLRNLAKSARCKESNTLFASEITSGWVLVLNRRSCKNKTKYHKIEILSTERTTVKMSACHAEKNAHTIALLRKTTIRSLVLNFHQRRNAALSSCFCLPFQL